MKAPDDEVLRSLIELLAIAKLAMPSYLFDIDPRVHRARQLLATLQQVPSERPLRALPRASGVVDLAPPPTSANVEPLSGPEPPWDITAGLDAFMKSELAPETRTEAVVLILRDWLIGHGLIGAQPADEQRH